MYKTRRIIIHIIIIFLQLFITKSYAQEFEPIFLEEKTPKEVRIDEDEAEEIFPIEENDPLDFKQEEILLENTPSIETINNYIANEEYFNALKELEKIPQCNDTRILKAKIYLDLNMHSNAEKELKGTTGSEAELLKYTMKREKSFMFFPNYMFYNQVLSNEYDLDYSRLGLYLSEGTIKNSDIYIDYGIFTYNSGSDYHQTNVVNELIGGFHSRPNEKIEYNVNVGAKFYQFGIGNMFITNSWLKYYQSDKINWKIGYYRNNVEQSYVSAVGLEINNAFVGQVSENRFYLEGNFKLPYGIRARLKGIYGLMYAQNLPTNQYLDGIIKLEKTIYDDPKNNIIQKVDFGIITHTYGYRYDLLNLYDQKGNLYGGYFSPSFYNATVGHISAEGEKEKWGLRYGIKAFAGEQVSIAPDFIRLAWGFAPFIEYNLNNHIAINLSYIYSKYSDSQRHILFVNTIFRGFRK